MRDLVNPYDGYKRPIVAEYDQAPDGPTRVLNTQVPCQKSIVLQRLAALPGVTECTYSELRGHRGSSGNALIWIKGRHIPPRTQHVRR